MDIILYLAANRLPNVEKLSLSPPDAIIIDLEESVPIDQAENARAGLVDFIETLRPLRCPLAVRINGMDNIAGKQDLKAVSALPADVALLVPKPINEEILTQTLFVAKELWVMGEEVGFAQNIAHYATLQKRLTTVIIGTKDLAESMGLPLNPAAPELRAGAVAIKDAVKAAGLRIIDGVAFGDETQIGAAVLRARDTGFDGVTAMLPRDIATIRAS
jgi:citrate lyase beta subunit